MGEEGGRGGRGRGGKPCLPVVKRFVSVLGEVENFSNADNKVNLIVSGDLIRRHAVRRTTERNGWVERGGGKHTHTHTCARRGRERKTSKRRNFSPTQDGSFFLPCEDFGRMVDNTFPDCAFFFSGD